MTAFLTNLILAVIGLVWHELRLTEGQRTLTYRAGLISAYLGLIANIGAPVLKCGSAQVLRHGLQMLTHTFTGSSITSILGLEGEEQVFGRGHRGAKSASTYRTNRGPRVWD